MPTLTNSQIAGLSKADLRRMKAQIDFQLTRDKEPVDRDGIVIFDALRKSCRMAFATPEKFVAQVGSGNFSSVIEYVNAYIDEACGRISANQRAALTETLFSCLAEYLKSRGEAPTALHLCEQIEALPFAVDQQFPGYADSKLLHLVVRTYRAAIAA